MILNKKYNSRGFASVLALVALVLVGVAAIALTRFNFITRKINDINAQSVEKIITLNPTEDAYVSSLQPNRNFGSQQTMTSGNRSRFVSYLKFDLSTLTGKTLTSAKLKFKITEGTNSTQDLHLVTGGWTERTLTFRNKPVLGTKILSFQPAAVGSWSIIDLTQYLPSFNTANLGSSSFAITSTQPDSFNLYSKESIEKPVLEFTETVSVTPSPTASSSPNAENGGVMTPMPSGTPVPNGTSASGGFGVGSGGGPEIGINLAKFSQVKSDAANGVYDRPCTAPEHDKTKWHSLVNVEAKCHYDHEHGDDPNYVNDIFGEPGAWFGSPGQSISYPWQTFSLPATTTATQALTMFGTDGQRENDLKHTGYYWVVRRNQGCDGNSWCITDSRLAFHFMSSHHNEVGVRFHSFSFEGRLCKNPSDPSSCGIYRTGGWTDHGQLFTTSLGNVCWNARNSDPVEGTVVSLPSDTQFFPLYGSGGLIDEFRCHKVITDAIVKAFPNGYTEPAAEWWTHGASDFRYVIRVFDPVSNVDTVSPTGVTTVNAPFCAQGDATCRWNNSVISAGQGYTTQIYKDYDGTDVDANGDNKTDLSIGKVYMNRFGDRNYNCTSVSVDCIPLIITGVPLGDSPVGDNQRYSNKQCETCEKLDHDITPAGRPSWIDWFYKM